jgi:transcriptional regulator with XRE-family HTH domain
MPPLEEEKIIGERFAQERERLGLSQQKFGELVGLQQAGVNAVEKEYRSEAGTLRSTSVEKLIRSAKVFGCSLEYLVGMVDDRRSVADILTELEAIKKRGIVMVASDENQTAALRTLADKAPRLSNEELHMVALLCQRLTETHNRQVATQEADEAARIIDRLPAEQRLAALASVKDMEDNLKSSVDELRGRMQYLLELVQDVSGIDARAEVERRFNVRI